MAGLVDALNRDLYCGATIISNRYAITAAHCMIDRNASQTGLLVGDHDISTGKCKKCDVFKMYWFRICDFLTVLLHNSIQ